MTDNKTQKDDENDDDKNFGFKVHIFWEGHKILRNLHLRLDLCTVVKFKVEISQNFVAFSEYMNFTRLFAAAHSLKRFHLFDFNMMF